MRRQRVRVSWIVVCRAWPTCSFPVTFGGGIMMLKRGLSDGASASKMPISAQARCHFSS
jgi:hypothetical protein